jgi:murein L,D-transpeptidase YcbB/YkuD
LANIGNALAIAFRLVTHMGEIQRVATRVATIHGDVQRMLPQLLATINEAQRTLSEANVLLGQIAPEFFTTAPMTAIVNHELVYDVRWLQASLNAVLGTNLEVDGILGPLTQDAIRQFQHTRGLTVDGWCGIVSQAALAAEMERR